MAVNVVVAQILDDAGAGGGAFELALRVGQGRLSTRSSVIKFRQAALSVSESHAARPGQDWVSSRRSRPATISRTTGCAEPFQIQMRGDPFHAGNRFPAKGAEGRLPGARDGAISGFGCSGGSSPAAEERGRFLEFLAHGFGGDAEAQGGFLGVGVQQNGAAGFVDGFGHGLDNGAASAVAGQVVGGAQAVQIVIKETAGILDQFREGRPAKLLDVAVRVVRRGNGGDANGEAGGQEAVERADGGVLAGVVGIEAEDHFLGVAFEDAGVVGGEGGALRGDDILDARHEAGDEVELAFADDGATGVQDGALGFVQPEHDSALGEDGAFRGIDVFGGFLVAAQHPAAEADDAALFVADGKIRRPRKRS